MQFSKPSPLFVALFCRSILSLQGFPENMMHGAFPPARRFRVLVVADIDLDAVNSLASKYVPDNAEEVDMIVACGPFTHAECTSDEEMAVSKANLAAIMAQLECIVCRVAYLASDHDPTEVLTSELHLTPNSVNIHARMLPLAKGLFLSGFAETRGNLRTNQVTDGDEDEELEGVTVTSGVASVELLSELLQEVRGSRLRGEDGGVAGGGNGGEAEGEGESPSQPAGGDAEALRGLGLFALNYKYSHTLNHFLFHMPEELERSQVGVAVVPPPCASEVGAANENENENESENLLAYAPAPPTLPASFGNLHIVSPGSLRRSGTYAVLTVAQNAADAWEVASVVSCSLE